MLEWSKFTDWFCDADTVQIRIMHSFETARLNGFYKKDGSFIKCGLNDPDAYPCIVLHTTKESILILLDVDDSNEPIRYLQVESGFGGLLPCKASLVLNKIDKMLIEKALSVALNNLQFF